MSYCTGAKPSSCHKGHSIKCTTLFFKDCKTRGNSRGILEWKLGRSIQMKWTLRQGNKRNSNFILNKRQAAFRISLRWQRTASTFTNGNACNIARCHPSSHSQIESLALAAVHVPPMVAYSLNGDGMLTSKIPGLNTNLDARRQSAY
jgi:hypothetical protein